MKIIGSEFVSFQECIWGKVCGSVVRLYYVNLETAVFSHLITTGEGRFDCIMYI